MEGMKLDTSDGTGKLFAGMVDVLADVARSIDCLEKASLDIVNLFYQVFDKGMLADGEGRLIDFSNTVIFLTSNLATQEITQFCADSTEIDVAELVEHIRPQLSRHFKPALLARMTIIPYQTLGNSALELIAKQKLDRIAERLLASAARAISISSCARACYLRCPTLFCRT